MTSSTAGHRGPAWARAASALLTLEPYRPITASMSLRAREGALLMESATAGGRSLACTGMQANGTEIMVPWNGYRMPVTSQIEMIIRDRLLDRTLSCSFRYSLFCMVRIDRNILGHISLAPALVPKGHVQHLFEQTRKHSYTPVHTWCSWRCPTGWEGWPLGTQTAPPHTRPMQMWQGTAGMMALEAAGTCKAQTSRGLFGFAVFLVQRVWAPQVFSWHS
jgi:hypothetical protein